MVKRKRIHAYIARIEGTGNDQSRNTEISRTMSKAYSGFVHGASPQIMDMYLGDPPHFHVRGMIGTIRMTEYEFDIWNYFYRGIMAFGFAAKALGDDELFRTILMQQRDFEMQSGRGEYPWHYLMNAQGALLFSTQFLAASIRPIDTTTFQE